MGNEWDSLWNQVTRAGQGAYDQIGNAGIGAYNWMKNTGSDVYNWGSENPMQAASLLAGGAGTLAGVWDQYQANQRLKDRQKLAEQYAKMGPGAFAPNYSPAQLQAMYFRPASQNMALAGQTDGGSFRQALADSALKAESDRIQLGNQIFQSRVGSLGYGPPQGPSGNTGAFGGALQNIMLMNALKGRAPYGQQQYGQYGTQGQMYGTGGGDAGRDRMAGALDNTRWMQDNPMPPNFQLQTGQTPWGAPGASDQTFNLRGDFGRSQPLYPQDSMTGGDEAGWPY